MPCLKNLTAINAPESRQRQCGGCRADMAAALRWLVAALLPLAGLACVTQRTVPPKPVTPADQLRTVQPAPEGQMSDDELLTAVQRQTFKYFWDLGHTDSGMTRERASGENPVTTGGSGFGVMAILVGIERGFITRAQGIRRLHKIVDFLATADRYKGIWPHWMNGTDGSTMAFGEQYNHGDVVESAFMFQGLLTARQYMDPSRALERSLMEKINRLWSEANWFFYTGSGNEETLNWLWSPTEGFGALKITGWNEGLIAYVLAASSPNPAHRIDEEVYHVGWARRGQMRNGRRYYDISLPLGGHHGGPLFFAHYSFVGLDPRGLKDKYASYWQQNVAHASIHHAYCVDNPSRYRGYHAASWGLTASTGARGYNAHAPGKDTDKGVISPTAAIASLPYVPGAAMAAMRHYYYDLGDKLWGDYGFYDAFSASEEWVDEGYLAIDQGPIILMIENYRTGMLWQLFMSSPEIGEGLTRLGFEKVAQ